MKKKDCISLGICCLLLVVLVSGCFPEPEDEVGTIIPPARFKNVTVNKSRANIGDVIEISWDYENSEQITRQIVIFHALLLIGVNDSPDFIEMTSNDRSVSFPFTGPVTIQLLAEGDRSADFPSEYEISIAFDLLLSEEYHFAAEFDNTVNTNYPRLGIPPDNRSMRIDFPYFLGIYDENQDGIIDELASDAIISQILPPNSCVGYFAHLQVLMSSCKYFVYR